MNAIVLDLPAVPGNPRNSEGAFVTLRDGRLALFYVQKNSALDCCGGRGTAVLQDLCVRRISFGELP